MSVMTGSLSGVRWVSFVVVFLTILQKSQAIDIIPNSTSTSTESPSLVTVSTSPVPSSTNEEEEEDEGSFVDNNLGLIIGVPTGLGLSIIGFIACFIYCGVTSAYQSYRERREESQRHSDYPRGTASTGLRSTPFTSGVNSSSNYNSSAFEPSNETLPRGATMQNYSFNEGTIVEAAEHTSSV